MAPASPRLPDRQRPQLHRLTPPCSQRTASARTCMPLSVRSGPASEQARGASWLLTVCARLRRIRPLRRAARPTGWGRAASMNTTPRRVPVGPVRRKTGRSAAGCARSWAAYRPGSSAALPPPSPSPWTALVEWLMARKLPGTSAAINRLTIEYALSVSGTWCTTPSSISATGWAKSRVRAASARILSGSRRSYGPCFSKAQALHDHCSMACESHHRCERGAGYWLAPGVRSARCRRATDRALSWPGRWHGCGREER